MSRRALAAFAALALAACGSPQAGGPPPSPALWEVSGPGGRHGWLFGTIHALPAGTRWRTAAIDQALAGSSVLVVEIANLDDSAAAQAAFRRLATTPGLPPLSQRVPAARRPALAALLQEAGVADGDFSSTETWAAALMLASSVRHDDPASGVDRALLARARRVEGLETFDRQFAIFDRLPASAQAALLTSIAADAAADTEGREAGEWLKGDIPALERDSSPELLADPQLREALQVGRNRAWAARIEQLLANGERPFVAVGTAHMFDPEGLPALLAEHGYTVKRVQ